MNPRATFREKTIQQPTEETAVITVPGKGDAVHSVLQEFSANLKVKEELRLGSDGAGSLDKGFRDERDAARGDAESTAPPACVMECKQTTVACGDSEGSAAETALPYDDLESVPAEYCRESRELEEHSEEFSAALEFSGGTDADSLVEEKVGTVISAILEANDQDQVSVVHQEQLEPEEDFGKNVRTEKQIGHDVNSLKDCVLLLMTAVWTASLEGYLVRDFWRFSNILCRGFSK